MARFGAPVYKISIDAGLTCPNRDGTLSDRGCIFCNGHGSGTGAIEKGLSPSAQLDLGLARSAGRADRFILYFQSFTNTYAPAAQLKPLWDLVYRRPELIGLSVGTRPDCLSDDVLDLLAGYTRDKTVWLELGLQSASNETLNKINRGHTAEDFLEAVRKAKKKGLETVAHVILGLPGEGENQIVATARFLADLGVDGVKIHSLYVSQGTQMARMLADGGYECLTRDEYIRLAVLFLENIPAGMVIHRLTGDPDPTTLVGPAWSLEKSKTIAGIGLRLEELDTWQGRALGRPVGG